ncbi:unnamed protein product [Brassica rapa subsp. narinosa]
MELRFLFKTVIDIYIPKHVPFANKFCFSNAYCTFAAMSLETHTLSLYH